jgi:rfaE bifunctional protein kinase chain/domain
MDHSELNEILSAIKSMHICVFGDYFLDKYFLIDPQLQEISLETGLIANQVTEVRCSPGAAGTVVNNLAALGVGQIDAMGLIGTDGEGYSLKDELAKRNVNTDHLFCDHNRFTPTYMKPMYITSEGLREGERLDIKNRQPLTYLWEDKIMDALQRWLDEVCSHDNKTIHYRAAVIIADQVEERNCGLITDRIREYLCDMALKHPEVLFFADSRCRIGEYHDIYLKPNKREADNALARVTNEGESVSPDITASIFGAKCRSKVFLTSGEEGIYAFDGRNTVHIPSIHVDEPTDICGAGDSATAGIVCALCAGRNMRMAAEMGNMCASITIKKIGTTGTASPSELMNIL